MTTTTVFPTVSYTDARAGVAFLEAIGFTPVALYWDESDPALLHHGEFSWPGAGGLMAGSAERPAEGSYERRVGSTSIYCVVAADADVDAVHARALAAGGTEVLAPRDQDYGGRGSSVADAEGNQFSFGSYAGAGGES